ncbi:hypothetical protein NliqN6_2952 [Naganishia liquefaciens]|uniref:Uncharacterized protein n=1 Tax=Naganishia liquefaciens TaxID=104408 RepID=A0A8H3TTT9_9TREE|nr:hypothetical protein NliqN6_2952 [Naganishia liquefaciens]
MNAPDWSPAASASATATPDPSTDNVLAKEATIRDILALQSSLSHLLIDIDALERENENIRQEGEMLGMYMENLTRTAIGSVGRR